MKLEGLTHCSAWAEVTEMVGQLKGLTNRSFFATDSGILKNVLEQSGFVDVQEERKAIPVKDHLGPILDRIECMLFYMFDLQGLGEGEARQKMDRLEARLISEADGVYTE